MFQLANQSLKISVCYLRGVGAQRRLISMACNCRSFLKAKPMYFHKALVINLYCGFQYQQKGYFEGFLSRSLACTRYFFLKVLPLVSLWPLRAWIRTFFERNTSSLLVILFTLTLQLNPYYHLNCLNKIG